MCFVKCGKDKLRETVVSFCGRKGTVVAFAIKQPLPCPVAKLNSIEVSNMQYVEEVDIVSFSFFLEVRGLEL